MYCISYLIGHFIPRLSVSRVVQLTSATSMTLHTSMFFLLLKKKKKKKKKKHVFSSMVSIPAESDAGTPYRCLQRSTKLNYSAKKEVQSSLHQQ
jgi:hypothetical protein